jgi:hypothetical protein
MADENELQNPDDTSENRTNGVLVGIGVVVAVVLVLMGIGAIATATANPPAPSTCSTSCLVFLLVECPGNRTMNTCFGYSICGQPLHACGVNPP